MDTRNEQQSNVSQNTSMRELASKLQGIESPSTSKDEEQYYTEDPTEQESQSDASIPMAHREYEKILRQLEAECRTHIKCEQQMKLHIECLQEKMDGIQKDNEVLNEQVQQFETAKKGLLEEMEKTRGQIDSFKKDIKLKQVVVQKL